MKNFKEILERKNKIALIVQTVKDGSRKKITVHFPQSGETKVMFDTDEEIVIKQLEQAGYVVRKVD